MMLKALVLVCSIQTGEAACSIETPVKAVAGPAVSSLALCEFQSTVLSVQNKQIADTFLKASCIPAPGIVGQALADAGFAPSPQLAAK